MTERLTRVAVRHEGGRVAVELRSGLLAPRLLSSSDSRAEVALIATTATLLGGDHVRIAIDVDAGARLDLRDVAGTVAYDGRGREALWDIDIRVAEDADLRWHGEPLVVSSGASVVRSLTADIDAGGRLLLRDTVALGRTGEAAGSLSCHTRMTYADRPALAEDLHFDAESAALPGILAGSRVVDTVTAIGWQPGGIPDGPATFALAQPGSIARELLTDAHRSLLPRVWKAWQDSAEGPASR